MFDEIDEMLEEDAWYLANTTIYDLGAGVGQRVYLADLRARVGDTMTRERFDTAAIAAERLGLITMLTLDHPAEITPEIAAGAVHVFGHDRHILYVQPIAVATLARYTT